MRISRLFTESRLTPGCEAELEERACRYIRQVLRLRAGQSITLFNGDGVDYAGELLGTDRRTCRIRVGEPIRQEPTAILRIHLGIGVSRGERMDYAIQKSVELGVYAITPLSTERAVVQLQAGRLEKRLAHWRGVIVSACEQCGRNRIPTLHDMQPLRDWVAGYPGGLMLHHQAEHGLSDIAQPTAELNLLVGPEGGLSKLERATATDHAYQAVRLGPRVLRTETAPLAALAAIQVLWGDFATR